MKSKSNQNRQNPPAPAGFRRLNTGPPPEVRPAPPPPPPPPAEWFIRMRGGKGGEDE